MTSFGPVAAHYDRLMNVVPYRMWASYLLLLFSKQGVRPKKILDVCCGTGIMCELLTDEGFELTGFDLSPEMIAQAREKAELAMYKIRYKVADAADFEFNYPNSEIEKFDAAFSFFDSLNYIYEPEKLASAFKQVGKHLPAGASFIFDMNTAYAFEERMFDQQHLKKDSPLRYRWRGDWNPETRIIKVTMKFWAGQDEFVETHIQRAYSEDEIREMLDAAGFGQVEVFHAYSLDRPRANTDRIHYAAIKRNY
ncbi:MAG: methyltransferase domain-containing protein [Fimbriimonadaceae bacterium]